MTDPKPCPACALQPSVSGLYIAGCRPCDLRRVIRSQPHWTARREKRLRKDYLALLAPLGDPVTVHKTEIRPLVDGSGEGGR